MRVIKDTTEWRWEAYNPETGAVAKKGPIRTDLAKVDKYAREIAEGIAGMGGDIIDSWNPAPYWDGLKVRIVSRTISPWVVSEEVAPQSTDSLV